MLSGLVSNFCSTNRRAIISDSSVEMRRPPRAVLEFDRSACLCKLYLYFGTHGHRNCFHTHFVFMFEFVLFEVLGLV